MPRKPALPTGRLSIEVAKQFAGKPSHERPSQIQFSTPEPGFFKRRYAKGGPWVPAIIWQPCPMIMPEPMSETPAPEDWCCPTERGRPLRARIGDREASPDEVWTWQRTTCWEYRWRLALREWAKVYAPAQPEARERERADLSALPSLF